MRMEVKCRLQVALLSWSFQHDHRTCALGAACQIYVSGRKVYAHIEVFWYKASEIMLCSVWQGRVSVTKMSLALVLRDMLYSRCLILSQISTIFFVFLGMIFNESPGSLEVAFWALCTIVGVPCLSQHRSLAVLQCDQEASLA